MEEDVSTEDGLEPLVRRGIALLEGKVPDFRVRVNWDTLDMENPHRCVLGQLAPGVVPPDHYDRWYGDANYFTLVSFWDLDRQTQVDHGFWLDHPWVDEEYYRHYELLGDTWKRLVRDA